MEINGIGGAKGNQGTPRGEGELTEKSASAEMRAEVRKAVADVLRISQQGRERAKSILDPNWVRDQVESANQQIEAKAKELKTQRQCQLIAARIMAGDRVSPEDLNYLAEHDMEQYAMALAMKRRNPDPKKCDRISEEEEASATGNAHAATPAPAVPSEGSAPETGGGEE